MWPRSRKRLKVPKVAMCEFKQEFELSRQRVGQSKKRQKVSSKPSVPHIMDQPTAKLWIPPTTSIWLSNGKPEWWGHCQPYVRVISKYSSPEDEPAAIQRTIRMLWGQYLEREGKSIEDCPYDIF